MKPGFRPSRWWRNAHLQTIWPVLTKPSHPQALNRQRLELTDGDFIDLDWQRRPDHNAPLLLLVHGLEGSADSHYMRRLLSDAENQSLAAVAMHQRSCSGEPNRLTRSYHSGASDDLMAVITELKRQYPESPLWVVGYSLGGNQLVKYLGEQREYARVERAVVVSAPLDLAACARRMERGFSRVYQTHLIGRLQQKTRDKLDQLPLTEQELSRLKTFYQFDDRVTAPLNGFSGAEDYYQQASGKAFLAHIAVPTLLLHAVDDPFMTEAVIPAPDELSPSVELELCPNGGHVGFIEGGWPWSPRYYLERRILGYLAAT
ncbi:hydrolase [Ferrimonas gelatinilytica]|uniref:hydrolase n=1 Tax=Ferrimonas gelatinilytica TaxID=1255257 RepID=UPI003CD0AFE1